MTAPHLRRAATDQNARLHGGFDTPDRRCLCGFTEDQHEDNGDPFTSAKKTMPARTATQLVRAWPGCPGFVPEPSPEYRAIKAALLARRWQLDAERHGEFYCAGGRWSLQWSNSEWVLCEGIEEQVQIARGENAWELLDELDHLEVEA